VTPLRPVEKADLFRISFVTDAALSPDGSRVVYSVARVDVAAEKEYGSLHIVDIGSGETRRLTEGDAVDAAPRWSPDGSSIAFLSDRVGGTRQIHVIPAGGGPPRAVTSFARGVGGAPAWSPDGSTIAFTAVPDAPPRDPSRPFRVDRVVYRFDGIGYLDDEVQSLYVVPATGGTVRRLIDDRTNTATPQWSPDGTEILVATSKDAEGLIVIHDRPRIVDVATGRVRDLIPDWGSTVSMLWDTDGSHVVFVGRRAEWPNGSKADLWVVDAAGGEPVSRSAGFEVGVGGTLQDDMRTELYGARPLLTADGSAVYLTVQRGGTVEIARVALDGPESVETVVSGDRTAVPFGVDAERLLFLTSDINAPVDIGVSDLDGSGERRLTALNDDLLGTLALPAIERLSFPGADGVEVEGWLITPAGGTAPHPTVLYIHGGPHSAFGRVFHFDAWMLAGAGYAVLYANHRGSTGYGDAFATGALGGWGDRDYRDLMAGVDHVVERGLADPDRLGVCGLSGGGNLTSWIVGQTDRFKAAVPENPVTSWPSFYGVSDIGIWFGRGELGGDPWEIPEVYERCSPITFAHRCTTPTLLIQGENDYRCPAEQSEQFYTRLQAVGCTVEMLRLPGEPHAGSISGGIPARIAQNDALLDWMTRYIPV
jgi:dipeptidyl aminopeptidase/acylaminoacyl peptidase